MKDVARVEGKKTSDPKVKDWVRAKALTSENIWSKAAGHRRHDNRRPDRVRAAITKGSQAGEPCAAVTGAVGVIEH
jgi:hypothetical protein